MFVLMCNFKFLGIQNNNLTNACRIHRFRDSVPLKTLEVYVEPKSSNGSVCLTYITHLNVPNCA